MRRLTALLITLLMLCSVFHLTAFADTEENLTSGLGYVVEIGEPIFFSYGDEINSDGILTDGVFGNTDDSSDAWFRANSGASRSVIFNFGESRSVSALNASFLHFPEKDILVPRYIRLYLSDNGNDYQMVGEYTDNEAIVLKEKLIYNAEIRLRRPYSAQYVKLEFACDKTVYCDEIAVLGSSTLTGNEKKTEPDLTEPIKGFVSDISGSRDIVRLYNGHHGQDHSIGVLTEDELLPYIAYLNANGDIAGKMFDSVLLSPCNGDAALTTGWSFDDWSLYLEHTFTPGQDLDAADKVAGRVYGTLGLDEKLKIYLTIPYPVITDLPFGDYDGDGDEEYSQSLDERTEILEWYVKGCIDNFNQNQYENLTLAGFYWLNNRVDYSYSVDEEQLIRDINRYIGRRGYASFFSAGYLEGGFDIGSDLGFTATVMSSDFGEKGINGGASAYMLSEYSTTLYNNLLGASVGFSKNYNAYDTKWDRFAVGRNYEAQLYYGSINGYMNALNLYEQGMGPGFLYELCHSDTATHSGIYLRRLYDMTYRYINGNYNNMPSVFSVDTSAELTNGNTLATLNLSISDVDSHWDDITVEFPEQPLHGQVTASADKTALIYNADEGFFGTDSFTVCITDGYNITESVEVTITVEDNRPQDNIDTSVPEPPLSVGINGETPLWLIILLSVLGGAMLIVAVATIFKRKKANE